MTNTTQRASYRSPPTHIMATAKEMLAIHARMIAELTPPKKNLPAWRKLLRHELHAIRTAPSPDPNLENGDIGAPRTDTVAFLAAAGSNACENMPIHVDELLAVWQPDSYPSHPTSPTRFGHWWPTQQNLYYAACKGWEDPIHPHTAAKTWQQRLYRRHRQCFGHMPNMHPGCTKPTDNIIQGLHGITDTPDPAFALALLQQGYNQIFQPPSNQPTSLWRQSVMIEYLVVRVHPFTDGNGRMSRLMANDIIPTVRIPFAVDMPSYIAGLMQLQQNDNPQPWLQLLAQWQRRSTTVGQRPAQKIIAEWANRGWIDTSAWHNLPPRNQANHSLTQ